MNTALAVLNPGKVVLSDMELAIQEEAAGEAAAYENIPTRLSMPSGKDATFSTPDGEHIKSLDCIIIVSQMARAYWPTKGVGNPPMCASFDSTVGILQGEPTKEQFAAAMTARIPHPAIPLLTEQKPIPATFRCGLCPMSQFNSAHQNGGESRAQGCKVLRRLVLIVDGWTDGALLTLPPTSVKNFDIYASARARGGKSAYHAVRTRITLEQQKAGDNVYSVARFEKIGDLTPQEYAAVRELRAQYAALVRSMPIEESAEYETQGRADGNGFGNGSEDDNPF